MKILCCGSSDWRDEKIIFSFIWGLFEITDLQEESVTLLTTGDKGAGEIAVRCANKANKLMQSFVRHGDIEIKSFAIPPDEFTPAMGYNRNNEILDCEKPNLILAFANDPASSAGTMHLLELAKERGIPAYFMQRYS